MELSKRLRAVADLVTAGYQVADIGTDHAYIPIFLTETGKTDYAVAMDVNKGPLRKAQENICAYKMEEQIETRLSDGFSALKVQEVQSAVIAGMGGNLVIRILEEGHDVVSCLKECILQPQSEPDKVRAFLLQEGFFFIEEDMVEEDGKYYPMMKVRPPKKSGKKDGIKSEMWNDVQLQYGKLLLEKRHPVLKRYLEREIRIRTDILNLVIRILEEGHDVVSCLKECILQPQSEPDKVRAFLLQEGFFFIEEDMVEEDGKYYPMMKVRPPKKSGKKDGIKSEMWNDVQLQYGKLLLEKRHPVLKRYLEREIRIRTDILKSIEKKDSQKIQVRKRQLEEELNIAEKGMEYYAL